jgi:hypothetical protein
MAGSYEVILRELGPRKDKILSYLRGYSELGSEEASQIIAQLPATIRITNNKLEATIIKKALEAYGASVEIINASEGPITHVSLGKTRQEGPVSYVSPGSGHHEGEHYSPVQGDLDDYSARMQEDSLTSKTDVTNPSMVSPIKEVSGCGMYVVAGFLILVSGVMGYSYLF